VGERLAASGYAAGWRLVRWLPERVAYGGFRILADLAWRRRGRGVTRLESNLARVLPDATRTELRTVSRAGMRSYLRYWCDAFRLPGWDRERILGTCTAEGDEAVRTTLASGRGVVMALGHLGNWDHAGAWAALTLAPVTTVAERLRPEALYLRFLAFRQRLGMEILPLTGGNDVYGVLARRLRDGGFVPLLADRDLTARGVTVRFFGETARLAAGPAALALDTGAALHPVTIRYRRLPGRGPAWGIVIRFHPEVEVPAAGDREARIAAMTQVCADTLAAGIAADPQDWHMLQRVFEADLRPARASVPHPG
jgi:phosphatidylinositol dimannoside acyltransferase